MVPVRGHLLRSTRGAQGAQSAQGALGTQGAWGPQGARSAQSGDARGLMAEIKYLQDVDFDTDITGFSLEDLKALIEFDYSDDSYTPDEEEETFNNAIIQYVIIFDDEEQQKRWGVFLNEIKQLYPDLNTHGARISEYLFDKGF